MSAITFKEAITFIREQKCCNVKVMALDKRRICEYTEDESVEGCIAYLEGKEKVFASYGMVNIIATDEAGKKGNWTAALNWTVKCSNASQHNDGEQTKHSGYISLREAQLMSELETLKLQMAFDKRFIELSEKLEGKDSGDIFSGIDKLLPLLPLFTNDTAKIEKVIQLAGVMNNKQPGHMAGIAGTNTMSVEKTKQETDEQLKKIETNINELIKVCGIDKIDKLIEAAKNKPAIVDTALNFLT